jgi:uncharacterized protein
MSRFHQLDADDPTAVVMDNLTGAWVAGDREQIRLILRHLAGRQGRGNGISLDRDLLRQVKAAGLGCKALQCSQFHPSLAVVHIGHECNLSCTYCYAPKNAARMQPGVARLTAAFLGQLPDDLFIQFMGGEPLMHLDEMACLIEALSEFRKGLATSYGIQTNGLLLLKEGAMEFLQRHQIHFGISFDGPGGMSRARYGRRTRQCEGRVSQTVHELRAQGHRCGIIAVVNRHNALRLIELLDWCLSHGLDQLHLTPLLLGRGNGREDIPAAQAGEALQRLFHHWVDHKLYRRIAIDNFAAFEDNLTTRHRGFMCRKHPCGAGRDQLAFDTNGDIYPCDYLVGTRRFRIGNVARDTAQNMAASSIMAKLRRQTVSSRLKQCRDCPWLSICGHCLSSAFFAGRGIAGARASCEADAIIIREILAELLRNEEYAEYVASR